MCIRDSHKALPASGTVIGRTRVTEIVDKGPGKGALLYSDPVSYTHLRAHETVLDLVCRLLLEKKKHILAPTYARHYNRHTMHWLLIKRRQA